MNWKEYGSKRWKLRSSAVGRLRKKMLRYKYRRAGKSLARPGRKRLTGNLQPQKKLAYLGFQCLDHPPYSLDLAPSDYHLFPGLKKKNN
jgi:hypothetical protein